MYSDFFTVERNLDGQTCFENDYLEDEHCEKHEKMITTVISIIENILALLDRKIGKYTMNPSRLKSSI